MAFRPVSRLKKPPPRVLELAEVLVEVAGLDDDPPHGRGSGVASGGRPWQSPSHGPPPGFIVVLSRRRLGWKDELRWHERAALVVWWLGQFLFGACFVFALAALVVGGFDHAGIDAAMILLLTGFAILAGARVMLELAVRQRRRRRIGID